MFIDESILTFINLVSQQFAYWFQDNTPFEYVKAAFNFFFRVNFCYNTTT